MCLEDIQLVIPKQGEFDISKFVDCRKKFIYTIEINGLILSSQFATPGMQACRCNDIKNVKTGLGTVGLNTVADVVRWLEKPICLEYNKYFNRYIAECSSNSSLIHILSQQYEDIAVDIDKKDVMIRCTFHTDSNKLYFRSNIDTICGLIVKFSVVRSEVDTVLSVFSDKENKEEKEMSKELFGKVYGPVPDGVVAMDITGQLVIKPVNGKSYKRFDIKTGKIVDMLDHVFKLNGRLAYILPVNMDTISIGDVIVVGSKDFYVVKNINKDGDIKGINLRDSTMLDIVPESLINSDISFVPKVINLLKPGTLDPMLMMMVLDEEDGTMDTKTAMLMIMGMNQEENNMNTILPLMLMSKSDSNIKDILIPMMMNKGSGMDLNTMLPLLLLGDDKDSFKDLALMMMMMNKDQSNSGSIDLNTLLPLMLLDKNSSKKDMLQRYTAFNMMLQKQTIPANNKEEVKK